MPTKSNKELHKALSARQIQVDQHYIELLNHIKEQLQKAQLRASMVVNQELLVFYWDTGRRIIERLEQAKWGDKLFDALAQDLQENFPNSKGFSKTNLRNMYRFAQHYPHQEFVQSLPAQLAWAHHVVLIQALTPENLVQKQWYAAETVTNGWGYRKLQEQIKTDLFARQVDVIKTTNFSEKLPSPTSALAQEMIKDPYKFHFLTLGEEAHEKDIHSGLLKHVKQFLMELGQGFALYGTHYPIQVSGTRFEIDLLLYNTKLHCYVIVDFLCGAPHKSSYVAKSVMCC